MVRHSSRFRKFILIAAVLCVIAALTHTLWLSAMGRALVENDGPAKADIAVVLAGDYFGHRILKAGELVRQGYVPDVLVSGPYGFYGGHESDYAIPFAVHHGYPAAWFIPFPDTALSTRDEARQIVAELQRRNVQRFLLVTSDFHSARAARVFRSVERADGYKASMRVVPAQDEFFRADSWWHTRQSRKTTFLEWCKTIAYVVGL
ncbi:MAG TPA: YdcF family protein [Bryobacteraceae bacterium]|nr:YdcF family protein [Bryobacteraceae bacterium]